jgi:hypothetical protein
VVCRHASLTNGGVPRVKQILRNTGLDGHLKRHHMAIYWSTKYLAYGEDWWLQRFQLGERQFYLLWDANYTVEGRLHSFAGEDNGRLYVLCCISWDDAGETVREMTCGSSLRGRRGV